MATLRLFLSSLLFFSLGICQCGSTLHKKVEVIPIWSKSDAYIQLVRESGDPKGFDQPYTFYESEMRRILFSLYCSRYQYFHWGTSSRVFEESRVDTLAPFFQRAFLEAGPDDRVEFYLPYRASKLFGLTGETLITRGRAFVQGGKLHFQFYNIQEPANEGCSDCPNSGVQSPSVAWKLVPQDGQRYGSTRGMFDTIPSDHYLVIDLDAASPATPAVAGAPEVKEPAARPESEPPPAAAVQKPGDRGGVEARFEELKSLLDRGLITQKDYERKKQELLDAL